MRVFFFLNDTATPEIYPLSLHDALPIWAPPFPSRRASTRVARLATSRGFARLFLDYHRGVSGTCPPRWYDEPCRPLRYVDRSEEHTSELQSRQYLVCRLLLEKKKYRQSH